MELYIDFFLLSLFSFILLCLTGQWKYSSFLLNVRSFVQKLFTDPTFKHHVSCTDGKISVRNKTYSECRVNDERPTGKKNTTIEWDDGGKIGNKNKLNIIDPALYFEKNRGIFVINYVIFK